jgi:hypothetical protein
MSQRLPHTLEVHVSFERNWLAPVYLIDAYELLVPPASERKPGGIAESLLTPLQEKPAPAEEMV